MTPRDRKASGGMSATATASAAAHLPALTPVRNGADAPLRVLGWEEWFQNASAAQRTDMLTLAARQGLLYAYQVPSPVNGVKNKVPTEDTPHLQTMTRLLAGNTEDLAPAAVQPLTFLDQELDS